MRDVTRRTFIKRMGAGAMGVCAAWSGRAGAAGPDAAPGPFPRVEPREAGIDPDRLKKLSEFLDAEFAAGRFPGCAAAATRHGKLFLEEYRGTYAGPDAADKPFGPDVSNMLFSFSKGITATVVVMAHQDGLLDYDKPLSTYIPEFTGGGKEGITLRHLLTHSAGIPSAGPLPVFTEEQWQEALKKICAAEVEWAPGSKTAYHAVGAPFLAAEAVRRVSGNKPWDALCAERLFGPLGARSFSFGLPHTGDAVALVPAPKEHPVAITPELIPFLGHPAGGAFGRVEDMLRLLNLHLNNGVWEGHTLIQPDALAEMHTVQYARQIAEAREAGKPPTHEFWGLGWLLRGDTTEGWFGFGNVMSPRAFGHAGINTVMTAADPDTGLAVAFVTTASPADDATTIRLRNTVTNLVAGAVV